MALLNSAVLVPGAANYYLGAPGAAKPTSLASVASTTWTNIGHTSLENILAMSSEGGEAQNLSTMQAQPLRTTYSKRTEKFDISVHQFDAETLKLYFGKNMVDVDGDGKWLGPNLNPQVTNKAFLSVIFDGATAFAMYAPEAEIYRGDDFSLEDSEALATLPLSITPVVRAGNQYAYAMTPLT